MVGAKAVTECHRVYHRTQGDSCRPTRGPATKIRSRTSQIIIEAQRTHRHSAPAIREPSDSDLLSPVFLLARLDSAINQRHFTMARPRILVFSMRADSSRTPPTLLRRQPLPS